MQGKKINVMLVFSDTLTPFIPYSFGTNTDWHGWSCLGVDSWMNGAQGEMNWWVKYLTNGVDLKKNITGYIINKQDKLGAATFDTLNTV